MKNKLFGILIGSLLFLCWINCPADTAYTIEYAPNSPIKDIPLKNAVLHIQLFSDGIPRGFTSATTDENQTFTLKEKEVFAILSIKGEEKHHALCSGNGNWHNNKIMITCVKK